MKELFMNRYSRSTSKETSSAKATYRNLAQLRHKRLMNTRKYERI